MQTGTCVFQMGFGFLLYFELYVSPISTGGIEDGTFENPFSNLLDALTKAYELTAHSSNRGSVTIYLFNGDHFLIPGDARYSPTESNMLSLSLEITIMYELVY